MSEPNESERLRSMLAAREPNGWYCTWVESIVHGDDCECEHGDGYTVEEVGSTCVLSGEKHPMLVRDDGQYTLWALDLNHLDDAVVRWSSGDCEYPEVAAVAIHALSEADFRLPSESPAVVAPRVGHLAVVRREPDRRAETMSERVSDPPCRAVAIDDVIAMIDTFLQCDHETGDDEATEATNRVLWRFRSTLNELAVGK